MNKKLLTVVIAIIAVTVFCFSYGDYDEEENAFVEEKEIAEKPDSYEVLVEEREIVIYEVRDNKKTIIRKDLYMPAREYDLDILKKGIVCETREEALKIFEDFVS